jgi:membrane dipeptidase
MLLALKDNNGVIQINFGSSFVTSAAGAWSKQMKAKRSEAQNKHGKNSSQVKSFKKTFAVKNPYPFATTEQVIEHINHVVKLIGIDHVGIGSDFDGVGDSLPMGLKDVSDYPNLVQGLIEHGYSDKDIKKILSGNLLRVWQKVEKYAAKN